MFERLYVRLLIAMIGRRGIVANVTLTEQGIRFDRPGCVAVNVTKV